MKKLFSILVIAAVCVLGYYIINAMTKEELGPIETPISEQSPWVFPSEDEGFQINELGEGISYHGTLGIDNNFVVLFSKDLSITEYNFLQICFYKDTDSVTDVISFGFIVNGGDMFAGSFTAQTDIGYNIHSASLKTGWNVVTIKFSDILNLNCDQTITSISGFYSDSIHLNSYNGGCYYMFDVASGKDPTLEG